MVLGAAAQEVPCQGRGSGQEEAVGEEAAVGAVQNQVVNRWRRRRGARHDEGDPEVGKDVGCRVE